MQEYIEGIYCSSNVHIPDGASGGVSKVIPPVMIDGEPNYPFQLQIEYTSLDGDKCLRVITQTKPLTKDRELAEKGKWCSYKYTCIHTMKPP